MDSNSPTPSLATSKERLETMIEFDIQPKDISHGHFYVSLAKSFIRIVAGVCLVVGFPVWCGVGIIVAEALGILEEIV